MAKHVLGVDIGSGSVKLTLLARSGIIAATAGCEYPTLYPQNGWAEQNPESWCTAFATALGEVLKKAQVQPQDIEAIAPDAATHTAVLLDDTCKPVTNAILWTDQRSGQQAEFLKNTYADVIASEALNAPSAVWTLPQLMWIRQHSPQVWSKIRYILFAKDYLRYRLTGRLGTDRIDAAGSLFYNAANDRWSDALCAVGGIKAEWLPPIFDPADTAGTVTAAAAAEFGLTEGIRVLVGTTDTAMEVLAAGSVEPGHTTVKLATAGRICVVATGAKPSPFLFNYRHVVPGLWYPGTATSSCAASFRWFRDTLGRMDYNALDENAAQIDRGSEGLVFHPHLQGELTPYNDPLLRASYVGISSRHTLAHFTRATMEGIALSLRDCVPVLQEQNLHMTRIRIIGGGAKSQIWRQIVADVLGMDLEKAEVDDSSFGAALLAAVGAGWYSDYKQAAQSCIRIQSITRFDPKGHEQYERVFRRYKTIGAVLTNVYHTDE